MSVPRTGPLRHLGRNVLRKRPEDDALKTLETECNLMECFAVAFRFSASRPRREFLVAAVFSDNAHNN